MKCIRLNTLWAMRRFSLGGSLVLFSSGSAMASERGMIVGSGKSDAVQTVSRHLTPTETQLIRVCCRQLAEAVVQAWIVVKVIRILRF